MSPEQAEGKPADRRSDIFSFDSILYEMVSGSRPFAGDTRLAILSAIVNSHPKPITSPSPPELDRIIRRCLRKDPSQRFHGKCSKMLMFLQVLKPRRSLYATP
jgi:serine/threonine protein kinase